jgi:hypothetical protein
LRKLFGKCLSAWRFGWPCKNFEPALEAIVAFAIRAALNTKGALQHTVVNRSMQIAMTFKASSRPRSSALTFTTYFLTAFSFRESPHMSATEIQKKHPRLN